MPPLHLQHHQHGRHRQNSAKVAAALYSVLTAFLLLSLVPTACAQATTPSNFIRRNNHGSVAVGSFVYIDGGLYAAYDDDKNVLAPTQNTATLAIDMRQSWTNSTVNMTAISKGNSPVFFQPQFWADEENNAFYSWSGDTPAGYTVSEKSLWKFSADDNSWARVSTDSSFADLARPVGGYNAVANGVGYFVGGYGTETTDDVNFRSSDYMPVPGVVSFNFSSGEWANRSSEGWTTYGRGMRGQAASVPFGANNDSLLVLLGGESGTRELVSNQRGYVDFSSVSIYDTTGNGSWYSQTTTGEAPSPRDEFCMAATQGANSTELFVFGGWTVSTGLTHNDSYILSLPAFRWFKGPTNTEPRVGLSCHVVGSGKRQVLVVGGQNNNNNTYRWSNPDPWKQGLGIFDLTAMEWSDGYDADAPAYESPQVVKDWYDGESYAEPDWSSDTVKALFSRTSTETSSGTSSASPSSTAPLSPAGFVGQEDSSPVNVSAIAGGLIGGLLAAAAVGFAVFYYRRRKQRTAPRLGPRVIDELDSESRAELHGRSAGAELPTKVHSTAELPGSWPERVELSAGADGWYPKPVELPASRRSSRR